jgi:peptidoglycan/LPS O-acetylase OafA/YrhL
METQSKAKTLKKHPRVRINGQKLRRATNGLDLRRIPQLDGLRGMAIGLVVLHHFIYQFHPPMSYTLWAITAPITALGWSGVDLFFILSGFLIGGILVDARESDHYYSTFYIRRAFRILPLYLFLILVGFLLAELGSHGGRAFGSLSIPHAPWWCYLTFTQNFYFGRHTDTTWFLQPTWSLAIEEQFYLTLPLLIRKVDKVKLLPFSAGMVLFFCALRSWLYWHGTVNATQCYMLPFCRFDSLFIGVSCALLLRDQKWQTRIQKHSSLVIGTVLVTGCSFFCMNHQLWTRNLVLHTVGFTLIGMFFASLMMLVLTRPQGVVSRAFSYGPLMSLGTISYCVYLIHGPVIVVVDSLLRFGLGQSELQLWASTILGSVTTIFVAWASWTTFESRMIALGHRFAYGRARTREPVDIHHGDVLYQHTGIE